jgi:protein phosphatase
MEGLFLTDQGRVRSHNEDSGGIYYNDYGQFLAVIADGMGGHKAGDVASQMATRQLQEKWQDSIQFSSAEEIEEWLYLVVSQINTAIYEHAQHHEECQGMGTTIEVAICMKDFVTIAHIGDSRSYLLNEEGFNQIAEDHSLVNALVQSGQITKDEAHEHPRRNVVLKALGTEEQVVPDVRSISVDEGNKLLLCTDGLTDKMTDDELAEVIQTNKEMKESGQALIDVANDRGGEDNISLIIIQYDNPASLLEAGEES